MKDTVDALELLKMQHDEVEQLISEEELLEQEPRNEVPMQTREAAPLELGM
jgi:hypothetical protein